MNRIRTSFCKVLLITCCITSGQTKKISSIDHNEPYLLSKEEISQDFDSLVHFVENTHPKMTHTVNIADYVKAKQEIRQSLADMTTKEAWRLFSKLNPIFNDAHFGLMVPERNPDSLNINTYIEIIGNEVYAGPHQYSKKVKVFSIGNLEMQKFLEDARKIVRGESKELKNFVIQRRFSHYLDLFDVNPNSDPWVVLEEKIPIPTNWTQLSHSFSKKGKTKNLFEYKYLGKKKALLTIRTFDKAKLQEFEEFLEKCFETIFRKKIETLVIDVSENGGGARELSDKLLSYLTTTKYTPTSKITARVAKENINRLPHLKIGDTITLDFPQWTEPKNDKIFEGKIFVAINERTYSQALVFSYIVQDFNIGTLMGKETGGRSNQSAQVKKYILPNSGITVLSPLYIFYRPKHAKANRGVVPDIEVDLPLEKKSLKNIVSRQ
ncbi:S41 family peptidase [Flagellimonas nanhaiensis]|nr:S41 family peptidase [Allomuricauda nanhaiensis]